MPEILQYTNYDSGNSALPLLYADGVQDPGTLAILDYRDPNTYVGGVIPTGTFNALSTKWFNLADSQLDYTYQVGDGSSIGNTGFVMVDNGLGGAHNAQITLPSACKMPATATTFGFSFWLKPGAMTTGASKPISVGGACNNTSQIQWLMAIANAATNVVIYNMFIAGCAVSVTVNQGEIAQCGVSGVISGSSCTVRGYKNGAFIGQQTGAVQTGSLVVPSGTPTIGIAGGFGGYSWVGEVGRFVFQDFSVAGSKTPDDFFAADYALNVGRFS